ncbi:MAG TPA: DUF368 domain-containing protein [Acidimicrobiia bacterium]|nr:DUF368 domain-containing protein [Acidimicrobiia bacterium]
MQSLVSHFLRGFAMGTADLIPGVSGGTIALVLGVYERLIVSIRRGAGALGSLARFDLSGFGARMKEVEWRFIAPLLVGVVSAVLALSHLIERLLADYPLHMAGLFFGLVAGSIFVAWRIVERRDAVTVGVLVAAAIVTFWFLGLRGGTVVDPPLWAFFGSGAVAICAMILPGVSGSFMLLMMGMYAPVLGAVNDRRVLAVLVFALGCVIGLASFSTLLNLLLDRFHDVVIAAMVGLMVGSLRVLWPWPEGTDGTSLALPAGEVWAPVLLAAAGAAVVLLITRKEKAIAADVEAAGEAAETAS